MKLWVLFTIYKLKLCCLWMKRGFCSFKRFLFAFTKVNSKLWLKILLSTQNPTVWCFWCIQLTFCWCVTRFCHGDLENCILFSGVECILSLCCEGYLPRERRQVSGREVVPGVWEWQAPGGALWALSPRHQQRTQTLPETGGLLFKILVLTW